MHSPTPGLVAQMSGGVTHKRYRYAAVYVDHHSGYGYVHLQKTQTAEETLEGKAAFERHCQVFWGHSQALPRRQWNLRFQGMEGLVSGVKAKLHLLRSECPLSIWSG